MSGGTSMQDYDPGQLAAGRRSMTLLAALVDRGGRPAAVAPTVELWAGERQYGWFPVDTGSGRRLAVVTSRRLIVGGTDHRLSTVAGVEPDDAHWAVTLRLRGADPLTLRGPWVPWLTVVLCAELYGAAFPPGYAPVRRIAVPAQRVTLAEARRC